MQVKLAKHRLRRWANNSIKAGITIFIMLEAPALMPVASMLVP
jgi:hypothetical protein